MKNTETQAQQDIASIYRHHRFSIAPMLDWTDRHCRYFHRQLSEHALLYSEMITTGAIIHGKGDFLAYNEEEHPLALQLGGSNAKDLAHCAKVFLMLIFQILIKKNIFLMFVS